MLIHYTAVLGRGLWETWGMHGNLTSCLIDVWRRFSSTTIFSGWPYNWIVLKRLGSLLVCLHLLWCEVPKYRSPWIICWSEGQHCTICAWLSRIMGYAETAWDLSTLIVMMTHECPYTSVVILWPVAAIYRPRPAKILELLGPAERRKQRSKGCLFNKVFEHKANTRWQKISTGHQNNYNKHPL